MNLFAGFLNEQTINALGWNLFHIIWQGFLLAFILAVILQFLKNKSAQIRYLVAYLSLFLLVALSVYNFSNNLNRTTNITSHEIIDNGNFELDDKNLTGFSNTESLNPMFDQLKTKIKKIDKYFPLIVNLWLFGVLISILKFILGFLYTQKLKNNYIQEISGIWHKKFKCLQAQLKVNKVIRYLESGLVKSPVVIGYFKPCILIPAEMLTGMPSNQIEAIIAHEIAHIRRNDYILNVLQSLVETLFFFHPAVWFISSQIRKERENSCDDLALTVCKESTVYAKALVSIQELSLKRHYSAVAFSGRKKHLLNRVKRMIMKQQDNLPTGRIKSNFTDKLIASAIIISAMIALSFTYTAKTSEYIEERNYSQEIVKSVSSIKTSIDSPIHKESKISAKDTIHYHKGHYELEIDDNKVIKTYKKNGKKTTLEFKLKNGKAYDLYVNGEKIPEDKYAQYEKDIDETIDDIENAKMDIKEAIEEVNEIDLEKIQLEVQEAMKDVHIDMEEIQKEVARAMEEAQMVDVNEILSEVEMSMESLEDFDFDFDFENDIRIDVGDIDINIEEIKAEIEEAKQSIKENIDMEAIEREMIRVQEELSKIDEEKLRIEMEEGLRSFEEHDKKEVVKELQEKLEKLERLETEEK